jgi:hypothetical protein
MGKYRLFTMDFRAENFKHEALPNGSHFFHPLTSNSDFNKVKEFTDYLKEKKFDIKFEFETECEASEWVDKFSNLVFEFIEMTEEKSLEEYFPNEIYILNA